ncbi:RidA family protein [Pantoea sp. EABMAA-21]|uniref:RidA family protein n=1 Tax=unclassified Pantoea TaxID=2630326 RepID=UPI0013298CBD|nr:MULTISPECIES: RidA family protein [unclassified Pantoea]MDI9277207.1 RidA family protein [Pantoea sp. EABMAA-21]MXP55603.1 RidA family protein [Pantoea sp. Seng]
MSIINPAGLKARSYYNHVKIRPGTPVFPTGQVAWDEEGNVVGIGDMQQQVEQVYANIDCLLEGLGAQRDWIVRTTTYVTDLALVPHIHPVRQRFFEGLELPASTLFQISALAEPELLLEIDVVIMLP